VTIAVPVQGHIQVRLWGWLRAHVWSGATTTSRDWLWLLHRGRQLCSQLLCPCRQTKGSSWSCIFTKYQLHL